jgi:hypothetical protein
MYAFRPFPRSASQARRSRLWLQLPQPSTIRHARAGAGQSAFYPLILAAIVVQAMIGIASIVLAMGTT